MRFSCHNFWACSKICVNNHVLKGCEWVAAVSRSLTEGQRKNKSRMHETACGAPTKWCSVISESKQTRERLGCRERRAPLEVDIPAPPNRVGYVTKEPEVNTRGVGALHTRAKQRKRGAARNKLLDWMEANRADKLSDNIFPSPVGYDLHYRGG